MNKNSTKEKYDIIIGIDEVGRGPLAGPVYVGAVALTQRQYKFLDVCKKNSKCKNNFSKIIPSVLRDSKKLSESQRRDWVKWIKKEKIAHTTASISPVVIDVINIARASDKAAQKAYEKIRQMIQKKGRILMIADGSIAISPRDARTTYRHFPKADELIPAVSLASIVAKVARDAAMTRYEKKHPRYGFDRHKGYGTREHIQAIKKYGLSPAHRRSFLKNIIKEQKRGRDR